MIEKLVLMPVPRMITRLDGEFCFEPDQFINLSTAQKDEILFTARRLRNVINDQFNLNWQLSIGWEVPQKRVGVKLLIDPSQVTQPQGYELKISSEGMEIIGHDAAGVYYGTCTLNQLVKQAANQHLPNLKILDWPDFPNRGVMLDVSRNKVPKMETLFDLVDRLSSWKINQLQLYTEHTFAYHNHPEVWADSSPFTGEEILELDDFCRLRFVELVPNQNSFGHMARWLKHERYAHLAEINGPFTSPWGPMTGPYSLSPANQGSISLIRSLYDELLPNFSSRMFNVGCDETIDLGQGQSKALCEKSGTWRVYLDFLLEIYKEVSRRGFTMQFWGDIIIQHPDLVSELPRDVVALLWGYEADHPFDLQGESMASAGIPFYVCPGTSSWLTLAGRTKNALGNLLNAAENGLKHGAVGYLNTDWGDLGHWQTLPISYLGFISGAGFSWCLDSNRLVDISKALSWMAFEDQTGITGKMLYDLGNAYLEIGLELENSTVLFWLLRKNLPEIRESNYQISEEKILQTKSVIEKAASLISSAQIRRGDSGLIQRELNLTTRLLLHACRRYQLVDNQNPKEKRWITQELLADIKDLSAEYKTIWLERNRPGGLSESVTGFQELIDEYESLQFP